MAHVTLTNGAAAAQIVVNGTAGTEIAAADDYRAKTFLVKNVTGSATVTLTRDTDATGLDWDPGDGVLSITLEPGEQLLGTVASGKPDQTIHTLSVGR